MKSNELNYLLQYQVHIIEEANNIEKEKFLNNCFKKIICKKNNLNEICNICLQIEEKTHPWINWITIDKNFKSENLDQVIKQTSLKLDETEYRFIIISNSENLNIFSANKLLKTIEEPSKNYYYFFLTNNKNLLLPTIQSRSFCIKLSTLNKNVKIESLAQDIINNFQNLENVLNALEKNNFTSNQNIELIEQCISILIQKLKIKTAAQNATTNLLINKINILKNYITFKPQQGSNKIFYKDLLLNLNFQDSNLNK